MGATSVHSHAVMQRLMRSITRRTTMARKLKINYDTIADHNMKFQDQYGFQTFWSFHENELCDFEKNHPYIGATTLTYEMYFTNDEMVPLTVDIKGPKWVDLWRASNELVIKSKDLHHVFIEDFIILSIDPMTLSLRTGS
jgi:hypothetical protein